MIQLYDWKCDCGHMQSVKADDGPWCSAKTVMQLETALRQKVERLEEILRAEKVRSSHWAGCHEHHPICAYLRSQSETEGEG
jgi:hypothetical protein